MRKFCKVISVILVVLYVVLIPVNAVLRLFDNTVSLFFNGFRFWELENADNSNDVFKPEYDYEESLKIGDELCYLVEAEGAALLLNNGALPLANGVKVSTLSVNSVDLTYGGTGSGNVDASKADNLKGALEKSGFTVNETLWNWYLSDEANELKEAVSSGEGKGESAVLAGQAPILEIDVDNYPEDVKNSISEYGDAVIVTFSRVGGEGYDCSFPGYEGNPNYENYLELNANEIKLLEYAKSLKDAGKIKSIVVLINTSNALEVDFLKDGKYGVDAALWVGGLGIRGTNAVTDILAGKVNPSGSLVDTYCYDNFTSPAMMNFIAMTYGGYEEGIIPENASTYMVYQEGIYVGYKYYETRYFDAVMNQHGAGDYAAQYKNEVAYTFGHGLSYTSFTYTDMSVAKGTNEHGEACYNVTLTVNNTGAYDGKETVQIYLSSPYTDYDKENKIEKAAVQLIGFGKTDVIKAGESETITIQVNERDMAAYDAYKAGTYILDEGTYFLTAATDAHDAANNILAAHGKTTDDGMDYNGNAKLVYNWDMEFDAVTYSTSLNGTKIENQLSDADPNLYFGKDSVIMLTRQDWAGTMPSNEKVQESMKIALTEQMIKELTEGRYDTLPENYEEIIAEYEKTTGRDWHTMPLLGQDGDLTLFDMYTADYDNDGKTAASRDPQVRGDYDDPAWSKLLEQVTMEELVAIGDSFHWRHPVVSVNAPGSRDENGPQGLTVALFGSGLGVESTAFTSEDVMAATFNTELIYEVGRMIGENCLHAGVSCLYGPGANTHRTPYGGRNFEYYSEDGFLAGKMGGYEVRGILSKGVDVVMKHFALNDTEQDRLGQAAWLTEQAAREIYLKAFQMALEENNGRGGVMTAYTRWGTTWSGAHYGLMHNIMREEWGNEAMSITDNILVTYCNAVDAVLAGGVTCFDAMLPYATNNLKDATEDPIAVNAMVEAMHHDLYALAHSAAMNGVGPETTVKAVALPLIGTITLAQNVMGIVGLLGCIVFRKKD